MSRQRQSNGHYSDSSEFDFDNLPGQGSPFEQIETWTQWAGLAGAGTSHGLPFEVEQFVSSFTAPLLDTLDLKSGGTSTSGGGQTAAQVTATVGTVVSEYISGAADLSPTDTFDPFNIQIKFNGTWTFNQQAVVKWAADTLSKIITAGLGNDTIPNTTTAVDDVRIDMSIGSIDSGGSFFFGNTLAQTQITSWRTAGETLTHPKEQDYLPVTSTIKLDSYDLAQSSWSSSWDLIVLHEMIHAIGFSGNVFQNKGLVDKSGNFIGASAMFEYSASHTAPVPLDPPTKFPVYTPGSHWSESLFQFSGLPTGVSRQNELMTGIYNKGEQAFLSDVTVAALHDLGYTVSDPDPTHKYVMVDSGLTIL